MGKIHNNVAELVGGTPLVKVSRLSKKLEADKVLEKSEDIIVLDSSKDKWFLSFFLLINVLLWLIWFSLIKKFAKNLVSIDNKSLYPSNFNKGSDKIVHVKFLTSGFLVMDLKIS